MAQNIYRERDYESTVKAVSGSSMFENNARFLTFCAHYGAFLGKKKKLRNRGIEINLKTFNPYLKDIFVIANTSFNISSDPMVYSKEDALLSIERMHIKYLLTEHGLYERNS